jgi:hypothetical protein
VENSPEWKPVPAQAVRARSQSGYAGPHQAVVRFKCLAGAAHGANRSPASTDLNGSFCFHSGWLGAISARRARANVAWPYKGCSVQSVPSWSKVAMRSAGPTYMGLDLSVVSLTKARTISFAGPPFHDGKGSLWAWPVAVARSPQRKRAAAPVETNARRLTFSTKSSMESCMQPSIFLF